MMPIFELLLETYKLLKKHLWLYVGYAAWLLAPFAAFVFLSFAPDHWLTITGLILSSVLELFLTIWILLIFIRLTAALIAQQSPDLPRIQQETLRLIKSSLRVFLLQIVIVLGGLILFIVPGIIFTFWFAFSQQALVIDNKTDLSALETSKTLVKDRFFQVAWRLLGGPLILLFLYSTLVGLVISIIGALVGIDPATIFENDTLPLWAQMTEMAGELFFAPAVAIYSTLLFLHLKKTQQNLPLEKDTKLT